MALTQSLLKSLGIESEQRDAIMTAHQETLESIKAERDGLRDKAAKVPDLEGQIEALKAANDSEEWQAKYEKAKADGEKLQSEFDELKAEADKARAEHEKYVQQVGEEKANAEKLELYKELLREIGLDEKRVGKAARLKDLAELTVEDGKLADREELAKAEAEEWAEFIPQTSLQVPQFATPPKSEPTDEGPDESITSTLLARHQRLYGKAEGKTEE